MQRTRTRVLGLGLVGLLAIAGSAMGQTALGDGRAHDRNLQRGAGGVNTRVRDLDAQIKLNNAIVTGNAAYGRSFRGDVGYLATDEFRAGLGSNDLFKEQRISAGSAALGGVSSTGGVNIFNSVDAADPSSVRFVQRGIRGTDALRYQMALTTGTAAPGDAGDAPLTIRRAGAGASGRTVGNAIRSTSEFRAQRSVQPTVLGTELTPDGQQLVLLASPLMGVKVRSVESELRPTAADEPGRWRPTGVESQARMARERLAGAAEGPRQLPANAVPTRVETDAGGLGGVLDRFKAETQARTGVGGPIDTAARPTNVNQPVEPKPPAPRTAPGDKPTPSGPPIPGDKSVPDAPAGGADEAPVPAWLESLEDMRRTLRGEPPLRKPTKPEANPDKPEGADKPADDVTRLTAPRMTTDQKRELLDARIKMLIDAQGFDADKDAFTVEQIDAARKARVKINSMTAAAQASVFYVDRMLEGEKAMRDERYFDAEDAFSRALGAAPRDALAQAGRVHAQMGAGLYMSAAANMRDLFATRPEMIGVKYDATLMPNAERMKYIRGQLASIAAKSDSSLSGDAGLLMAYLAYQADDLAGVDTGLKAFGAKIVPENTGELALLELAAKIWKSPVPADMPVLQPQPVSTPEPANAPKPAGSGADPNK